MHSFLTLMQYYLVEIINDTYVKNYNNDTYVKNYNKYYFLKLIYINIIIVITSTDVHRKYAFVGCLNNRKIEINILQVLLRFLHFHYGKKSKE